MITSIFYIFSRSECFDVALSVLVCSIFSIFSTFLYDSRNSENLTIYPKETVENILAFNENVLVDEIKKIVFILDF